MLRTVAVVVAVVLFLALFVFGWDKSWSYVKGTQRVVNEEVDSRAPMRLEVARVKSLIDKQNQIILEHEDKILNLESRRQATAKLIAEAQEKLSNETELLRRIKALLDENREEYQIGRVVYSRAEVSNDSLQRLEAVKKMQETTAFHENLLADLDVATKQGRTSLTEARQHLVELKNAVARLEVRDSNAELRLEVARLTNAVAGAPLTADSELEKAYRNLESRVAQKENQAGAKLTELQGQFRIDYSGAIATRDASAEIGKLLESTGSAKHAPDALQTRPSAADSLQELNQ